MNKIILIGGGGHCRACIDVIENDGHYQIAGILDIPEKNGGTVEGYPILGTDEDISRLVQKYNNFFITLGFVRHPNKRINIFNILKKTGVKLPVLISPRAYVSQKAKIAEGTIVMHDVLINTGASIGHNVIVNSKALIEHDARIGNHCHISTQAVVNVGCVIGDNVLIGSGTVLKQGVEIVSGCIIGMGAVVTKSLKVPAVYIGNPLKKLEERQ